MKKIASIVMVAALSLFSFSCFATAHSRHAAVSAKTAEGTVTIHFFWSHDCPHCVAAHPFINKLKAEYPWLKVYEYEISSSSSNTQLFEQMARDHGRETSFVPTFFICDKMIVGYTSPSTTGVEIRDAILECHNHK